MYAVSEMQGWRICKSFSHPCSPRIFTHASLYRIIFASITAMEDAHATILNLDEKTGDEKASFFAVYDGHGGENRRYLSSAHQS